MKIVNIKKLDKMPVYDLTVDSKEYDTQNYILENGVVTHNTGAYYSANDIWIIGRQQEKEKGSNELSGFNFIINIEKSRTVKEKSKIPITVILNSGIEKWSGLFDIALEGDFIKEMSSGWYSTDGEKKRRKADIESDNEFWESLLKNDNFKSYVTNKFSLVHEG